MSKSRVYLSNERHRLRHVELHRALDELAADWALHNSRPTRDGNIKLFSNTTIMELMEWSHQQTVDPAIPYVLTRKAKKRMKSREGS
ncbi:MAG TPA: hypothetical protein VH110_05210 [Candidatus Acidoferrum sp.]|jgi:hypothetical protein|nr:hypothetical protein [Candidatus Acidoferrum sp.]